MISRTANANFFLIFLKRCWTCNLQYNRARKVDWRESRFTRRPTVFLSTVANDKQTIENWQKCTFVMWKWIAKEDSKDDNRVDGCRSNGVFQNGHTFFKNTSIFIMANYTSMRPPQSKALPESINNGIEKTTRNLKIPYPVKKVYVAGQNSGW